MKNIKKQWEKELENAVPALRKDVMDAPIVCGTPADNQKQPKILRFFSVRNSAVLAGCMAAILALCLMIPGLSPAAPVEPVTYPAAVMVEINPSVVFSVDENGMVTNVVATNADADVILSDADRLADLKGITISDAVKRFVDYAAQFGYLDLSQQSVIRISSCEDAQIEADDQLVNALKEDLEDYFRESGAYIAVAAQRMELEEFCTQAGMVQTENLDMFLHQMGEISAFYFDRHEELWEQSYQEAVAVQSRMDELLEMLLASSEISDYLKEFLSENLMAHLEIVFKMLHLDVEGMALLETPATYEEYLDRIRAHCDEMAQVHKENYETYRQEISTDDYDAFIESVIEQYGSLEEYWNTKK